MLKLTSSFVWCLLNISPVRLPLSFQSVGHDDVTNWLDSETMNTNFYSIKLARLVLYIWTCCLVKIQCFSATLIHWPIKRSCWCIETTRSHIRQSNTSFHPVNGSMIKKSIEREYLLSYDHGDTNTLEERHSPRSTRRAPSSLIHISLYTRAFSKSITFKEISR